MTNNGETRDRAIRNESEITHIKQDVAEIKRYIKKHFKGFYILFGFIILALFSTDVINTEDVKEIIAYITKIFS